jgi:hypothetical protein
VPSADGHPPFWLAPFADPFVVVLAVIALAVVLVVVFGRIKK